MLRRFLFGFKPRGTELGFGAAIALLGIESLFQVLLGTEMVDPSIFSFLGGIPPYPQIAAAVTLVANSFLLYLVLFPNLVTAKLMRNIQRPGGGFVRFRNGMLVCGEVSNYGTMPASAGGGKWKESVRNFYLVTDRGYSRLPRHSSMWQSKVFERILRGENVDPSRFQMHGVHGIDQKDMDAIRRAVGSAQPEEVLLLP